MALCLAGHGRAQRWLERNGQDWVLGDKLQGDKSVWKRATRKDALFLSIAAALNSEQLRSLFDWFAVTLVVLGPDFFTTTDNTLSLTYIQEGDKEPILGFLRAADLAITDICITEETVTPTTFREGQLAAVLLRHGTSGTGYPAELQLSDESEGTQKIFYMADVLMHALTAG